MNTVQAASAKNDNYRKHLSPRQKLFDNGQKFLHQNQQNEEICQSNKRRIDPAGSKLSLYPNLGQGQKYIYTLIWDPKTAHLGLAADS